MRGSLLQPEYLGAANHTPEGQQSLGHCHLDGFDKTFPADYTVSAGGRLHCGFGIDTNDALEQYDIVLKYGRDNLKYSVGLTYAFLLIVL